jgi:hypothetical protein
MQKVGRYPPRHFVFALHDRVERCLLCQNFVTPLYTKKTSEQSEQLEHRFVINDLRVPLFSLCSDFFGTTLNLAKTWS